MNRFVTALKNKNNIAKLEEVFTRIMSKGKADDYDYEDLYSILHDITGKYITVEIFYSDKIKSKDEIIFMAVYPELSEMAQFMNRVWKDETDNRFSYLWVNSSKWVFEIDYRLFVNKELGLTPREVTAITLHEIGHVIYSHRIPEWFFRLMKSAFLSFGLKFKVLLGDRWFAKLLSLPLINACITNTEKKSLTQEIYADGFARIGGYTDALYSALQKTIAYTEKYMKYKQKSTPKEQMQELIDFTNKQIENLRHRQRLNVVKNLSTMAEYVDSPYCKDFLMELCNDLSSKNGEYVKDSVRDDYIIKRMNDLENQYIQEFFFDNHKRLKKIDPADIDYVGIELGNITTNDDKMMIVSFIYNRLELIDYYLSLINSGNKKYYIPNSKNELLSMKDRLLKYKDQAINAKLPQVDYNVYIQYPPGYEG